MVQQQVELTSIQQHMKEDTAALDLEGKGAIEEEEEPNHLFESIAVAVDLTDVCVTDLDASSTGPARLIVRRSSVVREFAYRVSLKLLHVALFWGTSLLLSMVPCQEVGASQQKVFVQMYGRSSFPWNTLCIWMGCGVGGYVWVRGYTYGNRHGNPFKCKHGTYKQFIKLQVVFLCMYFVGPIWILNSSCVGTHTHTYAYNWGGACFDAFGFVLPFFIGLHFNYLDRPPLNQLTMTWSEIKQWNTIVWLCFGGCVLIGVCIAAAQMYLLYEADKLQWCIIAIVCAILLIALISYLVRRHRYLHVHHFNLFLFLTLLFPLQKARARLHVVLFVTVQPLRGQKRLVNVSAFFLAVRVHASFCRLSLTAS